ncbi:MAG: YgiT-type zinc finger protein [Planctomycetes bacterium]|nr:YgiT-type zinc finger protein [Planctomycetota bacterium]
MKSSRLTDETCGGHAVPAKVSVYRRHGTRHVLFRGIPALVCRECGQRLFGPDAVEAMEQALRRPRRRPRTVQLHLL